MCVHMPVCVCVLISLRSSVHILDIFSFKKIVANTDHHILSGVF